MVEINYIGPETGPEHRTKYVRNDIKLYTGDWPSGKAPGSGPVIGGSNPSSPAIFRKSSEMSPFLAIFSENNSFF